MDFLIRGLSHIWGAIRLRKRGALIAALISVVLAYFVYRPGSSVDPDLENTTAQMWADCLAKMDVLAVYPSQEDFNVCDILASITWTGNEKNTIRRGIRVGHLDCDNLLTAQSERQTKFKKSMLLSKNELDVSANVDIEDEKAKGIYPTIFALPVYSDIRSSQSESFIGLKIPSLSASS